MKYYKVMFNNAGCVSRIKEEANGRKKNSHVRHVAVLALGEDVDEDGEIDAVDKIYADRYKRLAKNVAVLGFKEPLPAWVMENVEEDLHFILQ